MSALKLTQFVRGWVNYFALADIKQLLEETDGYDIKHGRYIGNNGIKSRRNL